MSDASEKQPELSATGPTVDIGPRQQPTIGASGHSPSERGTAPRVAVVEGSGPQLTAETLTLLRGRLRLAAILLATGFSSFLLVHFFQTDFSLPGSSFLFAFHAATAVVLVAFTGALCRQRAISLFWLRVSELFVFGLPAAFLLDLQYYGVLECCREGYFDFPVRTWLVLIYTYALFIPNTLRRAAVVIGLMAVAPVALLVVTVCMLPEVSQLADVRDLLGIPLVLVFAAISGVFGVDTIGSLRREAFEARKLGQYRLTKRIGAGGMGEVYLAKHELMKRDCAIKLIRPGKAADPKVLARFQREVRATAKLSHWNTVHIFDYGSTADGTFYYVMEYLPGMSLAEIIDRYGPMPPARAIHFLRQVCDALSEAHAAGLIHRDIKPGNVFAAQRGGVFDVAKLLDFGLVKPVIEEQPMDLTTEGSITGTPWFMSPEQATGDYQPDARSDIYSLGAVGYYLLTTRPPFGGNNLLKVMVAITRDEVTAPSSLGIDVPADLEKVILRCLAKKPDDRYQTAAALGDALSRCGHAARWTRTEAAAWWRERTSTST